MILNQTNLLINIPRIRETLNIQSYSIDVSNEAKNIIETYNVQKIRIMQIVNSKDENLIYFYNRPRMYNPVTSILKNEDANAHEANVILFQSFIDTLYQNNSWAMCKVDLIMNDNSKIYISEVDALLYIIGKSKAVLLIDYYANNRNTRYLRDLCSNTFSQITNYDEFCKLFHSRKAAILNASSTSSSSLQTIIPSNSTGNDKITPYKDIHLPDNNQIINTQSATTEATDSTAHSGGSSIINSSSSMNNKSSSNRHRTINSKIKNSNKDVAYAVGLQRRISSKLLLATNRNNTKGLTEVSQKPLLAKPSDDLRDLLRFKSKYHIHSSLDPYLTDNSSPYSAAATATIESSDELDLLNKYNNYATSTTNNNINNNRTNSPAFSIESNLGSKNELFDRLISNKHNNKNNNNNNSNNSCCSGNEYDDIASVDDTGSDHRIDTTQVLTNKTIPPIVRSNKLHSTRSHNHLPTRSSSKLNTSTSSTTAIDHLSEHDSDKYEMLGIAAIATAATVPIPSTPYNTATNNNNTSTTTNKNVNEYSNKETYKSSLNDNAISLLTSKELYENILLDDNKNNIDETKSLNSSNNEPPPSCTYGEHSLYEDPDMYISAFGIEEDSVCAYAATATAIESNQHQSSYSSIVNNNFYINNNVLQQYNFHLIAQSSQMREDDCDSNDQYSLKLSQDEEECSRVFEHLNEDVNDSLISNPYHNNRSNQAYSIMPSSKTNVVAVTCNSNSSNSSGFMSGTAGSLFGAVMNSASYFLQHILPSTPMNSQSDDNNYLPSLTLPTTSINNITNTTNNSNTSCNNNFNINNNTIQSAYQGVSSKVQFTDTLDDDVEEDITTNISQYNQDTITTNNNNNVNNINSYNNNNNNSNSNNSNCIHSDENKILIENSMVDSSKQSIEINNNNNNNNNNILATKDHNSLNKDVPQSSTTITTTAATTTTVIADITINWSRISENDKLKLNQILITIKKSNLPIKLYSLLIRCLVTNQDTPLHSASHAKDIMIAMLRKDMKSLKTKNISDGQKVKKNHTNKLSNRNKFDDILIKVMQLLKAISKTKITSDPLIAKTIATTCTLQILFQIHFFYYIYENKDLVAASDSKYFNKSKAKFRSSISFAFSRLNIILDSMFLLKSNLIWLTSFPENDTHTTTTTTSEDHLSIPHPLSLISTTTGSNSSSNMDIKSAATMATVVSVGHIPSPTTSENEIAIKPIEYIVRYLRQQFQPSSSTTISMFWNEIKDIILTYDFSFQRNMISPIKLIEKTIESSIDTTAITIPTATYQTNSINFNEDYDNSLDTLNNNNNNNHVENRKRRLEVESARTNNTINNNNTNPNNKIDRHSANPSANNNNSNNNNHTTNTMRPPVAAVIELKRVNSLITVRQPLNHRAGQHPKKVIVRSNSITTGINNNTHLHNSTTSSTISSIQNTNNTNSITSYSNNKNNNNINRTLSNNIKDNSKNHNNYFGYLHVNSNKMGYPPNNNTNSSSYNNHHDNYYIDSTPISKLNPQSSTSTAPTNNRLDRTTIESTPMDTTSLLKRPCLLSKEQDNNNDDDATIIEDDDTSYADCHYLQSYHYNNHNSNNDHTGVDNDSDDDEGQIDYRVDYLSHLTQPPPLPTLRNDVITTTTMTTNMIHSSYAAADDNDEVDHINKDHIYQQQHHQHSPLNKSGKVIIGDHFMTTIQSSPIVNIIRTNITPYQPCNNTITNNNNSINNFIINQSINHSHHITTITSSYGNSNTPSNIMVDNNHTESSAAFVVDSGERTNISDTNAPRKLSRKSYFS